MAQDKKQKWKSPEPERNNPFGEFFREEMGHTATEPAAPQQSPTVTPARAGSGGDLAFRGQQVTLQRERKGRGGKTVTVVKGLYASPAILEDLARRLRQHCGAGGALDGDRIEVQGDQRDRVQEYLTTIGIRVKRSGG